MWQTVVTPHTRSSAAAVSLQFISSKYDIISLGSRLLIFRIRRHRGLIPFVMIVAAPGTAAMINDIYSLRPLLSPSTRSYLHSTDNFRHNDSHLLSLYLQRAIEISYSGVSCRQWLPVFQYFMNILPQYL